MRKVIVKVALVQGVIGLKAPVNGMVYPQVSSENFFKGSMGGPIGAPVVVNNYASAQPAQQQPVQYQGTQFMPQPAQSQVPQGGQQFAQQQPVQYQGTQFVPQPAQSQVPQGVQQSAQQQPVQYQGTQFVPQPAQYQGTQFVPQPAQSQVPQGVQQSAQQQPVQYQGTQFVPQPVQSQVPQGVHFQAQQGVPQSMIPPLDMSAGYLHVDGALRFAGPVAPMTMPSIRQLDALRKAKGQDAFRQLCQQNDWVFPAVGIETVQTMSNGRTQCEERLSYMDEDFNVCYLNKLDVVLEGVTNSGFNLKALIIFGGFVDKHVVFWNSEYLVHSANKNVNPVVKGERVSVKEADGGLVMNAISCVRFDDILVGIRRPAVGGVEVEVLKEVSLNMAAHQFIRPGFKFYTAFKGYVYCFRESDETLFILNANMRAHDKNKCQVEDSRDLFSVGALTHSFENADGAVRYITFNKETMNRVGITD